MDTNSQKILLSLPLAYASYITVTCPCDPVLSCHYKEYLAAMSVGIIIAIYLNTTT